MYFRLLFISIISAALACSCSDGGAVRVLDEAETLLWERPDSALTLLQQEKDMKERLSSSAYNRYLLLKTEAMDKTYQSLADIGYMPAVCDHYDFWGTPMERARAYYMLGGVFRDKGDAPRALTCYKDAVRQLPDSCSKSEHRLLSRIYGQMAALFDKQRYPQQEIIMSDKCAYHAGQAGDSLMSVVAFGKKSGAYWNLNEPDSAMSIVRRTYDLYRNIGYDDYAAALGGHYVKYYLNNDSLDKAKVAIDEYVSKSGLMQADGRHTKESNVFFNFYWGKYYEKIHKTDSAIYYYRELVGRANDMNDLENAYRGLMSVYKRLGQPDSVMKYAELFANANDTACIIASSEEVSRTNALYDYSESQQVALQEKERANMLLQTILVIIVIVALAGIGIHRYIRRLKRNQKELLTINEEYYSALMSYDRTREELQLLNADLSQIIVGKTQEIERLQDKLLSFQENNLSESLDMEQSLIQQDIVKRFHRYASKATVPSCGEWNELYAAVESLLPEFHAALLSQETRLNEKELCVCMLTRLNFIPSEVAVLMDWSKQRVSNIRSSANKKLFNGEGSKDFDRRIRRL